ncbi:MAG: S8 family serine peptidase [Hyphomonadaceae bacterium]
MSKKTRLRATVAPLALAMLGAPAIQAAYAETAVTPAWGDIDAFWGDIDAFGGKSTPRWGDIDAFWGDIDAFSGKSSASWGDIDAFWGDIDAFWGDIDAFWGDIDAFGGQLNASWGDIDAFSGKSRASWGKYAAFWGDIDAFSGRNAARWGDIDAFGGSANASWGDIDAFWGDIDAFGGANTAAWGDIDAFGGANTAAWGDIDAFWGDIDAFGGKAAPAWGDIDAFWGDIDAFWGDIDAFWGDIDAFSGKSSASWGDIDAFWGDIDAFWGDIDAFAGANTAAWGDIDAFWGDIDAFAGKNRAEWGDIDAFWGDIDAFWGDIDAFGGSAQASWGDIDAFWGDIDAFNSAEVQQALSQLAYGMVQSKLQGLVDQSAVFWGDAVQARTGLSFWDGFAAGVFSKYGIDLTDASTLAGLSDVQRARFMFDWYDGLMEFSGRDHVDYWMGLTNWNPVLSWAGNGENATVIGLIDFRLTDSAELGNRLIMQGGYDVTSATHGSAVATLMAAGHNGQGVMGIAPGAQVAAYNPFDATGTAGWADIALGMNAVLGQGASVVNMSLGVPNYAFNPEWASVYGQASIAAAAKNAVFVHAAGNEGVAQTQNINWDFTSNPNIIVVGSVGPTGLISPFSNTPGSACLLDNGVCASSLMNHFLVAPGEWVLVGDGEGGVTRESGTSFAAPMVSGAVALLQNRWGWLKQHPSETADILFRTATDLGAPGVDPVYGHGLLNIAASQSPINVSQLYMLSGPPGSPERSLLRFAAPGVDRAWDVGSARATVYEDIGTTFRDFSAPLDPTFIGTKSLGGRAEDTLNSYVADNFYSWFDNRSLDFQMSLASADTSSSGLDVTMRISPLPYNMQGRRNALPFATDFTAKADSGLEMRFGTGHGARALQGGMTSTVPDFDMRTGGANPVMGLASGGSYAGVETPFGASGARLTMGATERRFEARQYLPYSGEDVAAYDGLRAYQAVAGNVGVSQPITRSMSLNASYTYLDETNGLLGVQSLNPAAFSTSSRTDAMSFGMDWALSDRITFSSLATVGRTRAQQAGVQTLAVSDGGVTTSAFEAAVSVNGVFGRDDRARFALVQPMHVENGSLNLTDFQVTDRELGLISPVSETISIDGRARIFALEAYYGAPVLDGLAEVAGFVRAEASGASGLRGDPVSMAGASFRVRF